MGNRLGSGGCRPRRTRLRVVLLGCVAALVAACGSTELEVVSDPGAGQPPAAESASGEVAAGLSADPPPTGIPDTIPPQSTTTSSTTSSSTTTTTAPTTSSTDPDPGEPGGPGGNTGPVAAWVADHGAAEQSVAFVNQRRAENGLPPVAVNAELQADAEAWAMQMGREQRMYHNPNRAQEMPAQYGWWGENVAMGPDPGGLDQAWWESEGHRENILGANYDVVGIAFVHDDAGTYWAVQVFGGDGQ